VFCKESKPCYRKIRLGELRGHGLFLKIEQIAIVFMSTPTYRVQGEDFLSGTLSKNRHFGGGN
jgi:hypothetical protein